MGGRRCRGEAAGRRMQGGLPCSPAVHRRCGSWRAPGSRRCAPPPPPAPPATRAPQPTSSGAGTGASSSPRSRSRWRRSSPSTSRWAQGCLLCRGLCLRPLLPRRAPHVRKLAAQRRGDAGLHAALLAPTDRMQAIEDLNRQTGSHIDPLADPNDILKNSTRGLMSAVSSLPELTGARAGWVGGGHQARRSVRVRAAPRAPVPPAGMPLVSAQRPVPAPPRAAAQSASA